MTIQEKIEQLKKEFETKIAELEKQAKAEEKQSKVWKPKSNEKVWILFSDEVDYFSYDEDSVSLDAKYRRGNIFKTEKDAKWADQHRIVATELERFVAENDPHPITEKDWGDRCVHKHHIYYDYNAREIFPSCNITDKIANQVYASNEKTLNKAIKHIGEERLKKYYFGVDV